MAKYFFPTNRLEDRTSGRRSNIKNRGQRVDSMEGAKKSGLGCCHNYASSLGRSFSFHLLFFSCTILRPQSMTPGIACDSKSPMTDWFGPLVRPRFLVRYLADSRAWPSPLWAYNTFSYVLFLSFQPASPLCYILFHSTPFHSITPLISLTSIRFYSIPFDSFLCYSLRLYVSLVISESRCI